MSKTKQFWSLKSESVAGAKVGELLLYGPIGGDGGLSWLFDEITPKSFRDQLKALENDGVDELRVMINSDGGDSFAGSAIYSMLKRYNGQVTVYIDGLAASAASLVAMAGDTVIMPGNAMMMVHDPWTMAMGNASEFRQLAETLDKVRDSMISAYMAKTGLGNDQLVQLLNDETWMTAEEAVSYGFADQVEESQKIAACRRDGELFLNGIRMDISQYKAAPEHLEELVGEIAEETSTAPDIRTAEKALREAGLSQASAKKVLSKGWREAVPAEASTDPGETTRVTSTRTETVRRSKHEFYDEAIPYSDYGNAPFGTGWARLTLQDFTDKAWGDLTNEEKTHIANHFVWSDTGVPPERFSDLGGGHHKANGTSGEVGAAVFSAVSSGRMQQASWSGDSGVKSHLESHYHDFGKTAPWEDGSPEKKSESNEKMFDLFMEFQKIQSANSDLLGVAD